MLELDYRSKAMDTKFKINDEIIICTYTMLNENERANHVPTIIYVNESNQIIDKPLNQKLNAI